LLDASNLLPTISLNPDQKKSLEHICQSNNELSFLFNPGSSQFKITDDSTETRRLGFSFHAKDGDEPAFILGFFKSSQDGAWQNATPQEWMEIVQAKNGASKLGKALAKLVCPYLIDVVVDEVVKA